MVQEVDLTGVTISHFELLERAGSGGMGTVYLARDTHTDREVAVKVFPPRFGDSPERLENFLEEAHLSIQLDHPNIAKGMEVGEYEGVYYFAKEYIKGWTIEEALRESGAFREDAIIQIGLQMALALEESDKAGLVHKDIKPSNILMTMNNVAYITDFGLASFSRIPEYEGEKELLVAGTPHYMSPEQAGGRTDLDVRSDIYSLGITLYEMATGEMPYQSASTREILEQHISHEVADPRTINPEVSGKLACVLMKMMAADRENRYETPQQLQKEFYNLVQGKELIAEKEITEEQEMDPAHSPVIVFTRLLRKKFINLFPSAVTSSLSSFRTALSLMALSIIGLTAAVIFLAVKTYSSSEEENGNSAVQEIATLPASQGMPAGEVITHYTCSKDYPGCLKSGGRTWSGNSMYVSTEPVSEYSARESMLEFSLDSTLQPAAVYIIWISFKAEQNGTVTLEASGESGSRYICATYVLKTPECHQLRIKNSQFISSRDRSVNLQNSRVPELITSLKIHFTAGGDDHTPNRLLISEFALIRK